ncbi:MAG: AbiV family abortive infection protein [bacterium]|nr:AbiV family abortive infection protein [bacterium]
MQKKDEVTVLKPQGKANIVHPKETLVEATKLCLQNAKQFIDDARILISKKSYGHGFSLAVLASEEVSKALIYFYEIMGMEMYIKKNDIYNHNFKQFISEITTLLVTAISPFADMISKLKNSEKSNKEKNKVIRENKRKMELMGRLGTKGYGKVEKGMNHFKGIEKRKQLGFYVEINKEGKIISPKDILYTEAKFCIDLVYKQYQGISSFLNILLKDEKLLFKVLELSKNKNMSEILSELENEEQNIK